MTFKQLCEQCDELNALTGRTFRVRGQNGVVALHDETNSTYSKWGTNQYVSTFMEAMRRGFIIAGGEAARPLHVTVTVKGGCAEVTRCPKGVVVKINDLDHR